MNSSTPNRVGRLALAHLSPAAAIALCAVCLLFFWWDGVQHLVSVWALSPTYTHGFLILPATAALIWMGWRSGERGQVWLAGLMLLLPACLSYGIGSATDIRLFQHGGIALAIIALVAGFMGKSFTIRHRFALAFLLFVIPVGEGLVPFLQLLTAKGIMLSTTLFDVAAIRNGTTILTDAGDFLVERGCAGLRFLIASIVAGILGGHLFFSTRWKQAAFIFAAVFVPILANIIRASTVVLVGTWTDMERATGFDHIVYGWWLFAIILTVIIALGLVFAEDDAPNRPNPTMLTKPSPVPLFLPAVICMGIILAGVI